MDNATTGFEVIPALGSVLSNAIAAPEGPGLSLFTDEGLAELATASDRLVSIAEAARAAVVRELEARQATEEVASCSVAEWLRREHGHTAQRARTVVKDSVRIGAFPELVNAHASGEVSTAQAVAIARTLEELPDDLAIAELEAATATMIGLAAEHDPSELARLGWRLLENVAPDRVEEILAEQLEREEKRAAARRGLKIFSDHQGSWILKGSFDAVEGEELAAILNAYAESAWKKAIDEPYPDSPKDRSRLLADALMQIVRAHQARADGPVHGGDRPRVTLILSLGALVTGLGEMVLAGGSSLTAAEARRLACDCDLIPAVLDGLGVPLDVGREKRLVTPEIRAALVLRDRGCAFPGCDRPPSVCEAHHIMPWWAGGPTSLDNLVLLCPHHHRRVEPGRGQAWDTDNPHRWAIRLGADRLPEVIPPTGWDPQRRPRRHTRYTLSRSTRSTPLRR
ncbi:DUF222 domain-containing protein [Granulicoccus sp. GXG6511]|uniref:HNH endonuclease signature motif containing protein n=1 Tax=Granulicoccus sp. GXG6511 TaxID=3381351 RepID=UPI003D7E05C9